MTAEQFAAEYSIGYPRTVSLLLRIGADRQLVADFAQDAWAKAWRVRDQWKGNSSFLTWVNVIARNTMVGYYRKRHERLEPEPGFNLSIPSHEAAVDARLDVDQILRSIPRREAGLLRERFLQETDYADMAARRGLEWVSSARVYVNRATALARAAVSRS